ncbi:hypothetical protein Rsub_05608 [Raphidocelis subcapitata]|uniref:RING-type domain-containing protein n=1 Tax=Raphidocelis subcapitata TaxID=307507 RepID=A0A2V0NXQ9_9CHLO|nr:hypothetical protein Rsub_05608 [Raphidocelis subcapitata]|eukprot:GBF92406.1 hypothetical protein Rsub_05608 [Raphidocelis subcapitata]
MGQAASSLLAWPTPAPLNAGLKDPAAAALAPVTGQIAAAAKHGRTAALEELLHSLHARACAACGAPDAAAHAAAAPRAAAAPSPAAAAPPLGARPPPAARSLVARVVDGRTRSGATALMLACRRGHADAAELLLQCGASPTTADEDGGRSALHHAALGGSAACAAAVLARCGGDAWRLLDAPSADGLSPLHYAAINGHASVARVLLSAGASEARPAAAPDRLGAAGGGGRGGGGGVVGSTPLHLAAMRGHVHVAVALLEAALDRRPSARPAASANGAPAAGAAASAAAAAAAGERLPWEGDPRLDPRLCRDASGRTPSQAAEAFGHGAVLSALLDPAAPLRRALLRSGAMIYGDIRGIDNLRDIAARALNARLLTWLDRFEDDQEQRQELFEQQRAGSYWQEQDRHRRRRRRRAARRGAARRRSSASKRARADAAAGGGAAVEAPPFQREPWERGRHRSCPGELGGGDGGGGGACGASSGRESSASCGDGGSSSDYGAASDCGGAASDDDCCGICQDAAPRLLLAPCRHRVCPTCARAMLRAAAGPALCPFCRGPISAYQARGSDAGDSD